MKKFALLLLLSCICTNAAAKEPIKAPKQAAAQPAPAPAPAATNTTNAITKGFVDKGVLACTSRINQVTNFMTAGSSGTGAFLFIPTGNIDNQMTSVSMEMQSGPNTAYSSASFAPNQANGCAGVYEAIAYWPDKCDIVATKQFAGSKVSAKLKQNIGVINLQGASRVFLMPAGEGCISIKKELVQ